MKKEVIVIGGGAAGYFTAINIAEKHPEYQITIIEKSGKTLSKVKVSGGGRCNVTNRRNAPGELVSYYPRGGKKLYKAFERYSSSDLREWLNARGVETREEPDGRVFPKSNDSQTIVDLFRTTAENEGIVLRQNESFASMKRENEKWLVETSKNQIWADIVIVATGSSNDMWRKLDEMGFEIVPGVPSLFTFKIKDPRLQDLHGLSFPSASVKVAKTKLQEQGPLLITHWGLSGPAILKLSSVGARVLREFDYDFTIVINLFGTEKQDLVRERILEIQINNPRKKLINHKWDEIPKRYWLNLLQAAGLTQLTFGEIGNKSIQKLLEELTQAHFSVTGKSTFKEEFVTAGGLALSEIDLNTMESRRFSGLYFAGEVLDIDGLTGGFNFQACWTAGWLISDAV